MKWTRMAILFLMPTISSLAATEVLAYQFLCGGWKITGTDGQCPVGALQQDEECGCSVDTAPKWGTGSIIFKAENQGGNGVTASEFVYAVQSAAYQWNTVSCSSLLVSYGGTLAPTSSARWGNNNNISTEHGVFFVQSEQEWIEVTGAGGGSTLGVTVSPYGGWNCYDREISDTDILINGFWEVGWNPVTVEETILHEMGHSAGLGHPCLTTDPSCNNSCSAVMAATGSSFTIPQQDDVNAVCSLYPGTPGGLGSACTGSWDCHSGPCITYDGFTYCSQECGSCPIGYRCKPVNNQNVCVRKGLPEPGEPCSGVCVEGAICLGGEDGGLCYEECDPAGSAGECSHNEICVELSLGGGDTRGVCLEAAAPRMNCEETDGVCVDDHVCVYDSSDGYLCREECNPNGVDTCPIDERCLALGSNGEVTGGACFPVGPKTEGEVCTSANDCAAGLLCVGTFASSVCMYECNINSPSCPLPGQTCEPLQRGGIGVCDPVGGVEDEDHQTEQDDTTEPTQNNSSSEPVWICECDLRTVCEEDCACDPECDDSSSGCLSTLPLNRGFNAGPWVIALVFGLSNYGRRQRLRKME